MRRKLVVGNWKMNGGLADNEALLRALIPSVARLDCDVAVCVPFPYLFQARDMLAATPIAWGAQTLSEHRKGAYTGEVGAAMLLDFGCRFVIVGHSERRSLYGEGDAVVAAKFTAAAAAGLIPILCVGETLEERERSVTQEVVQRQLAAVVEAAGVSVLKQAVIAYEPVWAIGTGRTATPQQAQEVHAFIRQQLAREEASLAETMQILYGGSVKAQNARDLFGMPDIDGGLIGGASLVASDFIAICDAAT